MITKHSVDQICFNDSSCYYTVSFFVNEEGLLHQDEDIPALIFEPEKAGKQKGLFYFKEGLLYRKKGPASILENLYDTKGYDITYHTKTILEMKEKYLGLSHKYDENKNLIDLEMAMENLTTIKESTKTPNGTSKHSLGFHWATNYFRNSDFHRVDGPALISHRDYNWSKNVRKGISINHTEWWYIDSELHREDGAAYKHYEEGKLKREMWALEGVKLLEEKYK